MLAELFFTQTQGLCMQLTIFSNLAPHHTQKKASAWTHRHRIAKICWPPFPKICTLRACLNHHDTFCNKNNPDTQMSTIKATDLALVNRLIRPLSRIVWLIDDSLVMMMMDDTLQLKIFHWRPTEFLWDPLKDRLWILGTHFIENLTN